MLCQLSYCPKRSSCAAEHWRERGAPGHDNTVEATTEGVYALASTGVEPMPDGSHAPGPSSDTMSP